VAVVDGTATGVRTGTPVSRTSQRLRVGLAGVLVLDVAVIGVAILLAWQTRTAFDIWTYEISSSVLYTTAAPWMALGWVAMLAAHGAYSRRRIGSGPEEFRAVAVASLMTAGSVAMFCYLTQIPLSRGFLVMTFVIGLPLLTVERYAVRRGLHAARRRGHLLHRVVAVGGAEGISEVVEVLNRARYVGYEVVGVCMPEHVSVDGLLGLPHLGQPDGIRSICREVGADTVLVARGGYSTSAELRRIAWSLEGADVDLVVVPSLTDVAGPRISMRPVAGLPLLHLEPPQADEAGGLSKRAFDVVLALGLLLVLSPVMLLVAAAVKLQDGGPVLFHQPRVGRSGAQFRMLKFRSMVVDAEARLGDLHGLNDCDGVLFKMRSDPRVTPLGRLMRRFSVDELPQLINVVRGDMSIVGPRPPLRSEVDRYHDDMHRRLLVRPGVTGLWQVSGRSELSWQETVRLDLYYVDNWSLTADLVIIAKTVRAVVGRAGAY
jgi:exopolysaccharide biosynthesis polyprenyl glycosylphosphotransferase